MSHFDLETFWTALLSRDPAQIQATWGKLAREERAAVYAHLKRMVGEEGWSEPQRLSAQAALNVLPEPDTPDVP